MWESFYAFWDNSWTPELLSCLLAILALGGLLLLLGRNQDSVLHDLPIKLSINTIIAIFAAIIKALLIMPVAEGSHPRNYGHRAPMTPLQGLASLNGSGSIETKHLQILSESIRQAVGLGAQFYSYSN